MVDYQGQNGANRSGAGEREGENWPLRGRRRRHLAAPSRHRHAIIVCY